jgi:hypothetical protein
LKLFLRQPIRNQKLEIGWRGCKEELAVQKCAGGFS